MTTGGRWLVVAIWLVSAMMGFWFFQLRDQRPFESGTLTAFDSAARADAAEDWYRSVLPPTAAGGTQPTATVVHVYRPGCSCDRFTQPHLQQIVARYRDSGVRFVAASRAWPAGRDAPGHDAGLVQLTIPDRRDLDWLNSTPAALVYDRSGRLVYFGPYSSAAWCGASGGQVERVLDRLMAGQSPRLQPVSGGGCFCATLPGEIHG